MDAATRKAKVTELEELRQRAHQLEAELGDAPVHWQASGHYTAYYATTGFMLGAIGALSSLVFNIVGSTLFHKGPLKLIQVYLTFGLGADAVAPSFDKDLALAIGCCLYIGTGMVLGIPFQLVISRLAPQGSLGTRLAIATVLGIALWLVNFYGILSWLQPLLFGGNWIVEEIPAWVAALTHLVFAWTMALVYPWGAYVPYRRQTESI
jgi:hypothetical protein